MSFVPTGEATGQDLASGPRAGFWLRLGADLVDGLIVFIVYLLLAEILHGAGTTLAVIVGIGYFTYYEGGPRGQTWGKSAMKIRVVSLESGEPIGYQRALVRELVRIVSTIPLYLGYLWMLWDPEKQTWHDKASRAVVAPTYAYPLSPR
jgi:uncharacterized RDD family membrane protein YckC